MRIAKSLSAIAALGLIAAPVLSQAAEMEGVRTASPLGTSEGAGGTTGLLFAGFIAALVGVVLIASDDDEEPESP